MNEQAGNGAKRRMWRTWLIVIAVVLLYAKAVQVTKIDLQEPLKPKRQQNLVSLIRELARPDLFAYDEERRGTNVSIVMPCPEEIKGAQVTAGERQVLLVPNCATSTQDPLTMTGDGFPPNVRGTLRWFPVGASTTRTLTDFRADGTGHFEVTFTMPDVRPSDEPQRMEVSEVLHRQLVGPSDTALLALEKIIETILMALMASTIGTILAIFISFLAARNLMMDVKLPLAAVMGGVVVAPLAGGAAWWVTGRLVAAAGILSANALLSLAAFALVAALFWLSLRQNPVFRQEETERSGLGQSAWLLFSLVLALLGLALLAHLGQVAGTWLAAHLGRLGFLGNFVDLLSELTGLLLPAFVGLAGVLLGISLGGRYGQEAIIRLADGQARALTALLTAAGTVVLILGLSISFVWVNLLGIRPFAPETIAGQISRFGGPAAVVGVALGLLSLLAPPKKPYPIGITVYTLTRGTLNILRSIEPIMLGFVFVVWVGLGPFAGILALTLHSVADLGKLFSEEVENIDEGPREAIRATGANGVQSVVYGVVPQITPHYIGYIFYRWDINVRLSTIIGFVGGGGIGFVLQRFLNQLQYTKASVMVIAIALVVTVLDYASSRVRRRII